MERIHEHEINPFNTDYVRVEAVDHPDPQAGDANHRYRIMLRGTPGDEGKVAVDQAQHLFETFHKAQLPYGRGGISAEWFAQDEATKAGWEAVAQEASARCVELKFQHGPIQEAGPNGITDQALIAVVIHRWKCFQKSKWSNKETALSINKLKEAMFWQWDRTRDRLRRKVEGTNAV